MNNKSVSAVIGIILMLAIIVAIAATVYAYVSGIINDNVETAQYVEGNVTSVIEYSVINGVINNVELDNATVYCVTLGNSQYGSYKMLFISDHASVPSTGVELKFYYDIVYCCNKEYYNVYNIEIL